MTVEQRIERLSADRKRLLLRRLRTARGAPASPADGHRRLIAYLVAKPGRQAPTSDELRGFLLQRLPPFMVPSGFVPIDALPQLPNGKVDRHALAVREAATDRRTSVVPAANPLETQLMKIWDELIDVPQIGRDDNFFELGGHSLLLPRLIDRVQRDFGVALPLGIVFQAPTLKDLAEVIRAGHPRQAWRSLVGIRVTGTRLPLYMVHGLGGEIGYFYNLAEYLHPEQPVYGLQAPVDPFDNIGAMAAHYLAEVREHQPRGPYLLGGYCIGGCVAFEMARRLAEAGESVRLVAMIDAVMPARQSFARRLGRFAQRSWREQLEGLKHRAIMVAARLRGGGSHADELPSFYGVPTAFHAIARRHYRAQLHYVPRPYKGDVWLFRSRYQGDPDLGWRPLVRGSLQIQEVPGRHADVLKEPHLRETARQISMVVDAVAVKDS